MPKWSVCFSNELTKLTGSSGSATAGVRFIPAIRRLAVRCCVAGAPQGRQASSATLYAIGGHKRQLTTQISFNTYLPAGVGQIKHRKDRPLQPSKVCCARRTGYTATSVSLFNRRQSVHRQFFPPGAEASTTAEARSDSLGLVKSLSRHSFTCCYALSLRVTDGARRTFDRLLLRVSIYSGCRQIPLC